jgi:hypothetical protein
VEIVNYLTLPKNSATVKSESLVNISEEQQSEPENTKIIKSGNKTKYWKKINAEKEKLYGNSKRKK